MPFISKSEGTKRSRDRKENGKCTNATNCRSRLGLSTSFCNGRNENVSVSLLCHKKHSNIRKRHTVSLFFRRSRRATLSGVCDVHSQEKSSKQSRTSKNLSSSYNTSQPPSRYRVCVLLFQYGAGNCKKGYSHTIEGCHFYFLRPSRQWK